MGTATSVYVEIEVRAPMDAIWSHTQTPALHERWDLRFTHIEYLPHPDRDTPQRFRYSTRIGCGLAISGHGETLGQRHLSDGSAISALAFGSDEPLSLIREGRGYWKYLPTPNGVRFLTSYDYRTRFGATGAIFDRLIFRRVIGWATAWSFDRLRLWLETRLEPRMALLNATVQVVARSAVLTLVAYQSVIGKAERHLVAATLLGLGALDVFVAPRVPSARRCSRRPHPEDS